MQRPDYTRGQWTGIYAAAAAAGGAAGWFLLGPLWTIAGVIVGPPLALVAWAVFYAFAETEPTTHLANHEPYRALTEINRGLWTWRYLARVWPSQFREPLAYYLLTQAEALRGLHREAQALSPAAEAVAICRVLAAEKPRKFTPRLANALDRQSSLDMDQDTAALVPALEAAHICQDKLPGDELPPCAAQTLLLTGRLLAGQARYREAIPLLVRGWHLAVQHGRQDLLAATVPAFRAAYRADDVALRAAWRTETGGEPPDWIRELP
jgi:hypothetical protein